MAYSCNEKRAEGGKRWVLWQKLATLHQSLRELGLEVEKSGVEAGHIFIGNGDCLDSSSPREPGETRNTSEKGFWWGG